MAVTDTKERYGSLSRWLHWGMALLLLWQFLTVGTRILLEDSAIDEFMWSTHKPLGLLLFILIIIRILWALHNLSRRPSSVSKMASLGHFALYGLILLVPALGLLRQYGSGRSFEPFGITLFPGFEGDKISWMVEPGNLLHGSSGWVLLVLILGHIFITFWHRRQPDDEDVLKRMLR